MFLDAQFYVVTVQSHVLLIGFILTHAVARTRSTLRGSVSILLVCVHIFFRYKGQDLLINIDSSPEPIRRYNKLYIKQSCGHQLTELIPQYTSTSLFRQIPNCGIKLKLCKLNWNLFQQTYSQPPKKSRHTSNIEVITDP